MKGYGKVTAMLSQCYQIKNQETKYICKVKLLTIIFTFYIMLLPCIPCTDSKECDTTKTAISFSSNNHQEHQHENEACNPFCGCACCGQTLLSFLHLNKIVTTHSLAEKKQASFYNNSSLPLNFYGNIWQPPKLS